MALPLLADLTPRALVYDCMDELAAFKNAPRQMRQRETALLKSADLVLTGGPRLYEAKRDSNPNVVCLPSAVDANHYATARATGDTAAMERAGALQPTPARASASSASSTSASTSVSSQRLADADPTWQIVMVGPVVKIDPAALPRRANLHWLGQQPYAILPQLVAGWDVCLMPFALNESTEFISPTKTLEYMAAGKPVDIDADPRRQGDVRRLGRHRGDADDFIDACRQALLESPAEQADALERDAGSRRPVFLGRGGGDDPKRLGRSPGDRTGALPERPTLGWPNRRHGQARRRRGRSRWLADLPSACEKSPRRWPARPRRARDAVRMVPIVPQERRPVTDSEAQRTPIPNCSDRAGRR